jgi:hypothetical protein
VQIVTRYLFKLFRIGYFGGNLLNLPLSDEHILLPGGRFTGRINYTGSPDDDIHEVVYPSRFIS